ncbi:MAG: DUF433 domain-containing protein [Thermoguttaceae bacterium]|jgi:uncharacterized protein (DUF433 family)
MSGTVLNGVIHGRTIELEQEPELPDGQRVSVQIQPEEPLPKWLERFTVDPSIALGKLLIQGTRLLAEDVAQLVEEGRSDEELRGLHPELTAEDVDAVRHYAKVPAGLRSSFGGWAEDAEELDKFLEGVRNSRRQERPEPNP